MLRSDVEKLIENWFLGDKYVFKTYNWFDLDYIVIVRVREDDFECDKALSTSDMGSFTKDDMVRLVGAGIFIYLPTEHSNQDFRLLRSGGCTCGGYRLNPPSHAFTCRFYRPY